ncbi:MAG: ribonuclease J [Candidatus Margulisiibacteriota bacterium]
MLKLYILGGLDGIGKNMMALAYRDEMVVIDCGIMFPDSDMYGVDKIIPDFSFLEKHQKQIRGLIVTHGHEDHIGAVAYFLEKINVPIYGTRLTLGLVEHKLNEKGLKKVQLKIISETSRLKFKYFQFSFVRVSHSIPDGVMTVIDTPEGTIVHSGDFKIDYTPVDNHVLDMHRLAEIGSKGVTLLLSDSTNAVKKGHTLSERQVGESFERAFKGIQGRLLVATFSSNIHRIQQAIDVGKRFGRKVSFAGLSMENTAKIARRLGYLTFDDSDTVFIGHIDQFQDNQILILTTGSQGEPLSALTRISNGEYRLFQIKKGDTVIISALPIPGNEKMVYATIDKLGRKGIHVIYEEASKMHVSGHAYSEELKQLQMLLRPKSFIPIHGEFRHLYAHCEIVKELGVTHDFLIAENGDVIEVSRKKNLAIVEKLELHPKYIDSNGVCLEDDALIEERRQMANDGVVVFTFYLNHQGDLIEDIRISSRGVSPVPEEFINGLKGSLMDQYNHMLTRKTLEKELLSIELEVMVRKYMIKRTGKSPCVIPLIVIK